VDEARYLELGARFPAVCQVGGVASGALIARRWVLTAAHAVEQLARMRPGEPIVVLLGGTEIEVERALLPEERALEPDRHDIALLELAEPAPAEFAPLALGGEDVEPGTEFVFAGWGVLARGDEGLALSPEAMAAPTRRLRAGWNTVERIDLDAGLLIARFDGPETGLAMEAGPCIGDSGGPLLVRAGAGAEGEEALRWLVVGVMAQIDDGDSDRVVGEYGEEFGATFLAFHVDWVRETIGQ